MEALGRPGTSPRPASISSKRPWSVPRLGGNRHGRPLGRPPFREPARSARTRAPRPARTDEPHGPELSRGSSCRLRLELKRARRPHRHRRLRLRGLDPRPHAPAPGAPGHSSSTAGGTPASPSASPRRRSPRSAWSASQRATAWTTSTPSPPGGAGGAAARAPPGPQAGLHLLRPPARGAPTPMVPPTSAGCWWPRAPPTPSPTPTGCGRTWIIIWCRGRSGGGRGLEEVGLDRRGEAGRTAGASPGRIRSSPSSFEADLLIDASGPGGFLARHLPIPTVETGPHTTLVFGHFEGMADFAEVASDAALPAGPYPDEQAAVHHILEEGWMYVLPFDHGTVSAGFVIAGPRAREELASSPRNRRGSGSWPAIPTLREQFAPARPDRPIARSPASSTASRGVRGRLGPPPPRLLLPLARSSRRASPGACWRSSAWRSFWKVTGMTRESNGLQRYGDLLNREADHVQGQSSRAATRHDAGLRPLRRLAPSLLRRRQLLGNPPAPLHTPKEGRLGLEGISRQLRPGDRRGSGADPGRSTRRTGP